MPRTFSDAQVQQLGTEAPPELRAPRTFSDAAVAAVETPVDDDRPDRPVLATGESPESANRRGAGGVVRAAVRGLESAMSPFTLDAEHYKADRSLPEAVAEAATNFLVGRGTVSGVGALIGGPFGVLGANLLYSVYAGTGEEYSRSKAEGQDFSPARAGLNVALEANPLLERGGKLLAAARTIGQVAGQAGKEYSYTKSAERAAGAAVVGVILGYPMYAGMRGKLPVTAPTVKTYTDAVQTLGPDLLVRAEQRLQALGPDALKFSRAAEAPDEFKRFLTGSSIDRGYSQRIEAMSPAQLDDAWELFQRHQSLQQVAQESAAEMSERLAKGSSKDLSPALEYLKDAKYVARKVDRATDLNTEDLLDEFSRAQDQFQTITLGYLHRANRVADLQRKAKISNEEVGRALTGAPTRPDLAPDGQYRFIVEQWRDVFDDVRTQIRSSGYDVGYLDNYLPLKALSGADLAVAVKDRLGTLQTQLVREGKRSFSELEGPDLAELRDLAAGYLNKKADQVSDGELTGLVSTVLAGPNKRRMGFEPGAIFERTGELPEWAREYDVGRLFNRYINGNLKAVTHDRAFKQLDSTVSALQAVGLPDAAAYFAKYGQDMAGGARGTQALVNNLSQRLAYAGRRLEGAGHERTGRAIAAIPDFAGWLNTQVYPSYLGANVPAIVRNMTQTFATGAPELGGTWGYKLTAGALARTVGKARKVGFSGLESELRDLRLTGATTRAEFVDARPGVAGRLRRSADAVNEWSMGAYQRTDVANRAISLEMGREWAKQVQAGRPEALAAIRGLSAGAKAEVRRQGGLQAMDEAQLGNFLGDYLIGKTQFRYGKEQMSQFGREFGRAFSMFTKWPTMIGGDMADVLAQRGVRRGLTTLAQKYMIPYLALQAVEAGSGWRDAEGAAPDAVRSLVGGSLTALSPLESLDPRKLVDLYGGPWTRLGGKVLGATSDSMREDTDFRKAKEAARHGVKTYLPGVSQILNNIDRWQQARGDTPITKALLED